MKIFILLLLIAQTFALNLTNAVTGEYTKTGKGTWSHTMLPAATSICFITGVKSLNVNEKCWITQEKVVGHTENYWVLHTESNNDNYYCAARCLKW